MNQKKEKDETNGYRNTNGKESDDAEEPGTSGAECQSSGMTVSARCELHGINVKTYYYHLRQVRESLLTENCVVLLSTKNISDNIEIFSGDVRIKPAVFYLSERSRRQCDSLFNHQHRTGKRH